MIKEFLEHYYYLVKGSLSISIFKNNLKEGMVVLDIGSNIGYYPLIELNIIKNTGKLISVEPSPENYLMLKKNLALNGYLKPNNVITTYNLAISNKSEVKKFYISRY